MNNIIRNDITVRKEHGIHLRTASDVVRICRRHASRVTISCGDCPEADGCSILGLLSLGVGNGETVTVTARGEDASRVVDALRDYFSGGGGI